MRNTVLVLLLITLAGCRGERTNAFLAEPTDTRAPVATLYVTGPELPVHEKPSESAPVVITYQNGERLSVLAEQGEWAEVRIGDRSGWARREHMGAGDATQDEDNITVRFQKAPPTVTNLTAKGELYIEADVNTDGDVVSTRLLSNTTGSEALAAQNDDALRQAKFYPIVRGGERQPFKYYHRVTY